MSKDSYFYEMPWRTNYEMMISGTWLTTAGVCQIASLMTELPYTPFLVMSGVCAAMSVKEIPKAIRLNNLQKHLLGRKLEFINFDALKEKLALTDGFWLGSGFHWEQRHTQRIFEITKRDWTEISDLVINEDSFKISKLVNFRKKKEPEKKEIGQKWIHGVELEESDQNISDDQAKVHTLIIGTTGSGKTRCFDLLISQAIAKGETVIIIDPKGDKEMRDNARLACEQLGVGEKFMYFHPAFPEESVRLDPLKNFTRISEVASRITSIIQTSAANEAFASFAWQTINNIANGLMLIEERPSLVALRRYIESGADELVLKTVLTYGKQKVPDFDIVAKEYMEAIDDERSVRKKARLALQLYTEVVSVEHSSSELEGLLSTFKHDPAHFSKMIQNILPILNMLTSGELGKMLSPDPEDEEDTRIITDTQKIINNKSVFFIGLDSLTDNKVASALGSMILADLTSVAGDRYNFGQDNQPVNVFVDEAAEVLNDPFIAALNKGRGAKYKLYIATQTLADFTTRLGSKDKAMQVLGNVNNIISLRTNDSETQTYLADQFPPTRVKYVMRTQGQNTHGDEPFLHGGNQGERLMEEEAPLFPAQLFGLLPNLEYVAKLAGGEIIKGRLPILVPA